MLIGKRLKELRKAKGYSQTELGNLINVTKVSICGYESENRTPNLETLRDLTKVLNVSADYLMGNDINVINENDESVIIKLTNEDLEFINELKNNRTLYKRMIEDPKRFVELMDKKLN